MPKQGRQKFCNITAEISNLSGKIVIKNAQKSGYINVQGDPREPDIFKINSTQLFFK